MMLLIAATRLRLRSWKFIPVFVLHAFRSAYQARRAEGSRAVLILREARNTFWTCTVWTDEKAMQEYASSEPHRSTMRKMAHWCDEASVAHWVQESSRPPSWEEVHQRMQNAGRASKVNHPTEAHRAFQIPPPKVRRTGILKFK